MAKRRRRKSRTVRVEFLMQVSRHVQRIPGDRSSGVIRYWHEEGSIVELDRATAKGLAALGRVQILEDETEHGNRDDAG